MSDLTIEKIIVGNLNEYLNGNQIKISPVVFDEIVDYMKFSIATEYLKLTDWNQTVSISEIAAMTFRDGKYFFQDEDGEIHSILFNQFMTNEVAKIRKKSYRNPQAVIAEDKLKADVFKSYSHYEFKSYYNGLLNFYNNMNHDKIKDNIFRNLKDEFKIESSKKKHTEPKMKYYELVEFLSGYCMRDNNALKNTYRQFDNTKFSMISFKNYNAMVLYLKTIIGSDLFDEDIFSTPMFKFYSYYNIEKRYMFETVKTIAACLRYMHVKRIKKEDRELFLEEVIPLMRSPLINTRNELIHAYIRNYKNKSLDKWRRSVKTINEIVNVTTDNTIDTLFALNDDTLKKLHEDLIQEYESSKTIKQFNSFENNFECNIDFLPDDYNRVFAHYSKYLDNIGQNVKEFLAEVNVDCLEPSDLLDEKDLKFLSHSFEYVVENTLQDIIRLMDNNVL